jgi:hypothetical protein
MQSQNRIEPGSVTDIAMLESAPLDRVTVTMNEVIIDDRRMAGPGQRLAGVASNKPGTASDEDRSHQAAFNNSSKYAIVLVKPCRSATVGSQPSVSCAWVISGRRR